LALLRFTVTLDITDRLAVLMIAAEIDGLGPKQDSKPEFSFFRNTGAELCAARRIAWRAVNSRSKDF
jgi:hypothetical protein